MAIGYLSLFYDDARQAAPDIVLSETKSAIYSNYKTMFQKPNKEDMQDLTSFTQNELLKDMEQLMGQGVKESGGIQNTGIDYWNVNMAKAEAKIREATSEVEKVDKALEYIGQVQNSLSNAIEKGQGKVSADIIAQLKSNKDSLAKIAANFGAAVDATSFRSVFYSSVRGGIWRAQGAIHECAGALAGYMAQNAINKRFEKANQSVRVKVEATGGRLLEDSLLKSEANKGKVSLGRANNAKNDLTIMMYDEGNGQIIWHQGLSLKSTASQNPSFLHIATVSLGSLLNKVYNQQNYINLAAALGEGDWTGTRYGIGKLARKQGVSTSGAVLAQQWKEVVLNAIYSQLIEIFSGGGLGILNNAQYILVNSKPISMYDIFSTLESIKNMDRIDSIQGIQLVGKEKAIDRAPLVAENVKAFKQWNEVPTVTEARILRSTEAWQNVNTKLQNTKISIKLNYGKLGLGKL